MTTDREASKSGNVLSQGSGGQKSWSLFGASERTPAPTSECSLLVRASSPCFQTNDCRLGTCSLPLVKSGAPPCRDGRNGSPLRGPGEALHITDVSGVGVSYRAVQRSLGGLLQSGTTLPTTSASTATSPTASSAGSSPGRGSLGPTGSSSTSWTSRDG